MLQKACSVNDLSDPGTKQIEIKQGRLTHELFIVHKDGQFYAYKNSCPHTGAPLNWQEDQFLDPDNAFIQCAIHDARFEIENGHCVSGPCSGDHLQTIPVTIKDDEIFVTLT